jgi:hypothetical protein
MDLFIDWQPYETEFMGGTVTMEIRPLKNKAMMALAPYFTDDKAELAKNLSSIQGLVPEIFPEHVRNIDLTINQQQISPEQVAEESVLSMLVLDIVAQLLNISTPSAVDVKN